MLVHYLTVQTHKPYSKYRLYESICLSEAPFQKRETPSDYFQICPIQAISLRATTLSCRKVNFVLLTFACCGLQYIPCR